MKNIPSYIAGVDEAGRGPLAGPLTVAAVILDPNKPIAGLNDSKQLSQKKRELLFPQIQEYALAWHIEIISPAEIDQLNILQATLTGMRRAVCALSIPATVAHIDGNKIPKNMPCPAHALVGGDRIDQAIMAASILAKVHRDALMEKIHLDYPEYAFNQHKGYPTALHLEILKTLGPCTEHRRSYAPVKRFLNNELF